MGSARCLLLKNSLASPLAPSGQIDGRRARADPVLPRDSKIGHQGPSCRRPACSAVIFKSAAALKHAPELRAPFNYLQIFSAKMTKMLRALRPHARSIPASRVKLSVEGARRHSFRQPGGRGTDLRGGQNAPAKSKGHAGRRRSRWLGGPALSKAKITYPNY